MKKPSRLEQSSRTHSNAHLKNREKKPDARSVRAELERAQEELRQRTAELAIINSVQLGLARQLHVQDIYDLIGDKIREIFNAQVVMISIYDPLTDTVEHRYAIERGERVYVDAPQPVGGFRRRIIESGEPLLVNTNVVQQATRLGQPTRPGTEPPLHRGRGRGRPPTRTRSAQPRPSGRAGRELGPGSVPEARAERPS